MTRSSIQDGPAMVTVELTEVGDQGPSLLEAFQECQDGHCDCPTDQYRKVSAMSVEPMDDRIRITLEARPDTQLDTGEIALCLDHTIAKVHAKDGV